MTLATSACPLQSDQWSAWALSPCLLALAAVFGAILGSFLNVVIVRLPKGLSVVRPPSHCMHCGHPIAWYDNVPIVSYLVLRGRCRHCGEPFSARYALVELLTAALSAACFAHSAAPSPSLQLARWSAGLAFTGFLVVVSFIDLDTWIIPNKLTYPAIPLLGSLAVLTRQVALGSALLGAVAGFLVVAAVILGYRLATGREGMGWGDAKLLAVLGAFLGPRALPAILLLAPVQGLVAAAILMLAGHRPETPKPYAGLDDPNQFPKDVPEDAQSPSWRHQPLPFGPFLALAGIEMYFFGDRLLALWLGGSVSL